MWTFRDDPSGFPARWNERFAEVYRAGGHWSAFTLVDVARRAAERQPGRILLIDEDRRLTCGKAWDYALRLARYFQARGLAPGEVVSMQLPNWEEAAVILLAARICGLVLNPIPPIYREAEVAYILRDCGAKLLFIPEQFRKHDYAAMAQHIVKDAPALQEVVVVRGAAGPFTDWDAVLDREPADPDALPRTDPANVAMVMYTSGSSGLPKGVLHSGYTLDYRARAMGERWQVGPADVLLSPASVGHIAGIFWSIQMPWMRDCPAVLIDAWNVDMALGLMQAHGCTVMGGPAPLLQQLVKAADQIGRPAASALRLFYSGGAAVSPDLIRAAGATFPGCLVFRVYGATEAPTLALGIASRREARLGAETDGQVLPPTEVLLVDDDGVVVADGQEGEVIVRGPEVCLGYLHAQDNAAAFTEDGFFRMGDLGRMIEDGYLVITGRKKDIIIRSGENISPKEIEDLLFLHPGIAEAAIVAMPSLKTGEKACAFVTPAAGRTVDLEEIQAFLSRSGLAKQKMPEYLVISHDLPRAATGKVRKEALRQEAKLIAEREGL